MIKQGLATRNGSHQKCRIVAGRFGWWRKGQAPCHQASVAKPGMTLTEMPQMVGRNLDLFQQAVSKGPLLD